MRLRFPKPSLPLLIFYGIVIGVLFYYFDNRNPQSAPDDTIVSATQVVEPTRDIVAQPTLEATVAPQATSQFTVNTRQDIPEDTSIFIPAVGIYSDVIQAYLDGSSWDVSQLRSNAGHLEGTPWVSQPGNVVISGHVELSTGALGIFGALSNIELGDVIEVTSEGVLYRYIVTDIYSTEPTNLEAIYPTTTDRLTLITCESYDILTNAYNERLIVVAERVST